jgi:glycine C-acetyltransferase
MRALAARAARRAAQACTTPTPPALDWGGGSGAAPLAAALASGRRPASSSAEPRLATPPTPSPASAALDALLEDALREAKAAGTFKVEREIQGPQGPTITVAGRPVLNFCGNQYLGLANHGTLVAAARGALDTYGFGLASVRFICGTQTIHTALERRLAAFHGTPAAIMYPSCFDANAGLFEALLGPGDAVLSDALNHASIIDGVRLCKARRFVYAHLDAADLAAKLDEAAAGGARTKLVATDGVFSMDGDVANLGELADVCDAAGALLFVDDCHGTGVIGPGLRGTAAATGAEGRVAITNSTLGKALGGATGGYTAASEAVVATLRQRARPYLFSNTLAPPVVAAGLAALDLLDDQAAALAARLDRNTARFRAAMTAAGFTLAGATHPIAPVMLGDAALATSFADKLLARGVYVVGFSYPVVPRGAARIRVQLSAAHTDQHVDDAVAAFVEVGRELGVVA